MSVSLKWESVYLLNIFIFFAGKQGSQAAPSTQPDRGLLVPPMTHQNTGSAAHVKQQELQGSEHLPHLPLFQPQLSASEDMPQLGQSQSYVADAAPAAIPPAAIPPAATPPAAAPAQVSPQCLFICFHLVEMTTNLFSAHFGNATLSYKSI